MTYNELSNPKGSKQNIICIIYGEVQGNLRLDQQADDLGITFVSFILSQNNQCESQLLQTDCSSKIVCVYAWGFYLSRFSLSSIDMYCFQGFSNGQQDRYWTSSSFNIRFKIPHRVSTSL